MNEDIQHVIKSEIVLKLFMSLILSQFLLYTYCCYITVVVTHVVLYLLLLHTYCCYIPVVSTDCCFIPVVVTHILLFIVCVVMSSILVQALLLHSLCMFLCDLYQLKIRTKILLWK